MLKDFIGFDIVPGSIVAYADRVNNHAELKLYLVTGITEGNKRLYRPEGRNTFHVMFFQRRWEKVDDKVVKLFDPEKVKQTVFGWNDRCVVIHPEMYNDECRALKGAFLDGIL